MARARKRYRAKANPRGILSVAADGFGFVQTSEGSFFIPSTKMGGAFDGDEVEVVPLPPERRKGYAQPASKHAAERPAARVVNVISRAHDTVIGRVELADPFAVVVPADPHIPYDIFTMRSDNPDIPEGSIVRVRMIEYPSRNTAATGRIVDVLGNDNDPSTDISAVIARHGLETEFSAAALEAAASCAVDAEGALAAGYRDLRDRFVFTIDPVDARDFDDALSVEALDGGRMRLGVHIADVAAYVPWDGAVDIDARQRATSVYCSDRVIPMLPEALSNSICSLVAGEARRTMTVDVVLDALARVQSVDMYESVIASSARLSYEQAQCYLDAAHAGRSAAQAAQAAARQDTPQGAQPLVNDAHEQLLEALRLLSGFAVHRLQARMQAGGLELSSTEAKVVFDSTGEPCDVHLRTRTEATSCIEEAMILANECVAQRLRSAQVPALYRVHQPPTRDSLAALVPVLKEFSSLRTIDMNRVVAGDPLALQDVLDRVKSRAEEELVNSLVLRSMQRAMYDSECLPHYGLASDAYCHFTSPIRRYPDLVVHRGLKMLLHGRTESASAQEAMLPFLAEHSSKMERIADTCARETQELSLVRYMTRFVGQVRDGIVSGVAHYGIYVRLQETVEGVVPIRALGDEYFAHDTVRHELVGEDTGRSIRLGQRVRIRITAAPEHARKLDLRLVE